jgi:hypothetical protein
MRQLATQMQSNPPLFRGSLASPAPTAYRPIHLWATTSIGEIALFHPTAIMNMISVNANGTETVTLYLDRPEVANAYDEDLLLAMTNAMQALARDASVRALVIRGAGKHFQAGADINWLNRLSRQGPEENYRASIITVRFSKTLNELPKPTIAVIHGACFGGGVGIACCVDVALATPDSLFAISEVRHGIAPNERHKPPPFHDCRQTPRYRRTTTPHRPG